VVLQFALSSSIALADVTTTRLKNFLPGAYSISEGAGRDCRDEEFKIIPDTKRLLLGPYHLLSIVPKSNSAKSGLISLKGCTSNVNETVDVKGRTTILTMTEALKCGERTRYVLTETATITRSKVVLDVSKKNGDDSDESSPNYAFHCVWKKKRADH
jgi:hypothetical protein